MSSIFEPVTLTWEDKKYLIPAHQVLRAIAIVEEVITLHELMQYNTRGTAPAAKLSTAYGAVLRFAGAKVTDEQVYARMFDQGEAMSIGHAISALLFMMIPPSTSTGGSAEGNGSKGAAPSSKKRMRPSSAAPAG